MAESADEMLYEASDNRPSYTCWKPSPLYSLARHGMNSYSSFDHVVRTLHFEDYKDIWMDQQMIPNALTERTHTHLTKNLPGLPYLPGLEGLWYGIDVPDNGDNNWYGNVSFKINFKSFLQMLQDYKIYFVEVLEYRSNSALRLLITTQDLPLERYDPHRFGGPWYRDPNSGEDYFLTDARRLDGRYNYSVNVELLFVISDDQCASLFRMSDVVPVNHSEANSTSYHSCRKYRSGSFWQYCPSPWTVDKTSEKLLRIKQRYVSQE
nr:uncharacterized protein LOC123763242 [Procambarus clarkii]XP_045606301.1 uncharacterized protein LOC123763242 [Procambarus clarkii]